MKQCLKKENGNSGNVNWRGSESKDSVSLLGMLEGRLEANEHFILQNIYVFLQGFEFFLVSLRDEL